MLQLLCLIPFLPLAGFAVNGVLGARFLPRRAVVLIGCAVVLASFVISVGAIAELHGIARSPDAVASGAAPRLTPELFVWMPIGRLLEGFDLPGRLSYSLDPLAVAVVFGVQG